MKTRLVAPRLIALGIAALAFPGHAALAADTPAPPTHVALIDTGSVREKCKEFIDINKINSDEASNIQYQLNLKTEEIKNLQGKLDNDVRQLPAGAPEITQDKQKLFELKNNVEAWAKNEQYLLLRTQNLREYKLFHDLQKAIGEVCAARGYDMALTISNDSSQITEDQIDDADPQKLRQALYGNLVIYHDANPNLHLEITEDVIAKLDDDYKAAGNVIPPGPPMIPTPTSN